VRQQPAQARVRDVGDTRREEHRPHDLLRLQEASQRLKGEVRQRARDEHAHVALRELRDERRLVQHDGDPLHVRPHHEHLRARQ
jgi:hypothetical protein